ncbi:restriction endonuclease subunit S [Scytonema sp. PRP1]
MRLYDLKYISNTKTNKIERWIIKSGWVLVTCSGTIGRVAVSSYHQDGWAASQHILRIIPQENVTHPGFLAAFLSTPYGQHQLKAKIYGGVVDELTAEDTEMILIPDVRYSEQLGIGETVVRVYELRDEANALEDEAIAELEAIISD